MIKRLTLLLLFIIISCGGTKTLAKKSDNTEAATVIKKELPNRILGFDYEKQANIYFRNDVSSKKRIRVTKKFLSGKRYSEKKSKYAKIPEIIEKKEPFWPEYFPEKEIRGQVQVDFRIASNGKPDIICIRKGISQEIDLIVAKYVSEYRFKAAVGKRSGKKVAYWMSIMNQY